MLDVIKYKTKPLFYFVKPMWKMQREPRNWKKIFPNDISSKVLVSQIYFLKLKPQHNKIFLSIHLENGQMTWTDILLKRIDGI